MKPSRWISGALGLLLLLISAWQIQSPARGLQIIRTKANSVPVTFLLPASIDPSTRPLVLIAHGFAGSERLMRGFALTLAHAGFVTAAWDFGGHGANSQHLSGSRDSDTLAADAEAVLAEATRRGFGDTGKVAILGHSMGSGVALRFGQDHPETSATIAVSPVGVAVTPELPRNLLLMAGSLESGFVQNARDLLVQAGGEGGDPAQGSGRKLVVIPSVEHITILFNPLTHRTARRWLEATFGPQPEAQDYTDLRAVWLGVGVLGTTLAVLGLAPRFSPQDHDPKNPSFWRGLAALAGGALGGTLLLWLAGLAGLNLSQWLGMLVGGYLMSWFGVAGLLALLILRPRLARPSWKEIGLGFALFAALWVGVGLLGDPVWLPWLLTPLRLALWPLAALLFLPWFLAVGSIFTGAVSVQPGLRPVQVIFTTFLWWFLQTLVIVGFLLLALRLTPGLFFILLILPLFPLVLGIHAAATALQRSRWTYTLSAALFVAWLVVAVFPLS